MDIFKYELGDTVKDTVTPFQGVIVGRTEWLNGCIRYSVQPTKLSKDGNPQDSFAFDEDQLELVKGKKKKGIKERTGGPRPDVSFFNRG